MTSSRLAAAAAMVLILTVSAAPQDSREPARDLAGLRALVEAGRYLEAEQAALARVAALERERGPDDVEIANTLDVALEARRFGRRLTAPDSLPLAERALRIKEAALGPDDPGVAVTLNVLGVVRDWNRDTAGGVAAVERALAIHQRTPGPDSIAYAGTLNTLGWMYFQARRLPVAIETGERALALARKLEAPPGRETAAALLLLGSIHRFQGDSERAVRLFEEALPIEERVRGAGHPALAVILTPLSIARMDIGDIDEGRAAHERALRLIEAAPGSERRLVFELTSLANKLEQVGDFGAGLGFAERALAIAEKTAGADSGLAASVVDQIASLRHNLGDPAAAAAMRERTVALWTKLQGPESLHVAQALTTLADSYEQAGGIDTAFETIERAMRIEAFAKLGPLFGRAVQTYARLLARQGRIADARAQFERALRLMADAKLEIGRVDYAETLMMLARLERQNGQAARAVPLYRESLQTIERVLGPGNVRAAERRMELAGALAEAGAYDEARAALAAAEPASLAHLRLTARSLPDRRALQFAAERLPGVDLAVSLAADARVRAPRDVETAWQMTIQGRTVVLDEMAARQRAVIAEADDAIVRERWAALNHARARLANLVLRGSVGLSADYYQALVERTRAARDHAEQELAEASRAFRQERIRAQAGASEVVAALPRATALISYVRYKPQPLASGGASAANASVAGANVAGINTAGTNAAGTSAPGASVAAAKTRATTPPATTPPATTPPATTPPASAPPASALLTAPQAARPAAGDSAYAAFVARPGLPLQIVPLGRASEIEAAIATWRERLEAELKSGGLAARRGEAAYQQAGAALRALIWDPVRPHLGAATTTVFIVPDGAIHLVDLSTLPAAARTRSQAQAQAQTQQQAQARYLIDEPVTLHYLLAERDLLQRPPEPHSNTLLALGAPDFEGDASPMASVANGGSMPPAGFANATAATNVTNVTNTPSSLAMPAMRSASVASSASPMPTAPALTRSACEAFQTRTFDPLPATRQEVQHITDLWRAGAGARPAAQRDQSGEVMLLGDDRATEAAFKTFAPGRRVLHLATHGFFVDQTCGAASLIESPLLRSGLILAGANRRAKATSDEEDGLLTAEEIAGLDLTAAQWAVLSACDTGRGDWQAGEGVLGLRRAFEVAGARTVILSLWPVIDTVASDWMTELYRGKFVRGVTTAAAVRTANRALLAKRRASGQSTHPIYWSGFIASGDWR